MLSLHEDLHRKILPSVTSASLQRLETRKLRKRLQSGHDRSQSTDSGVRTNRNSTIPVVSFVEDDRASKGHSIPSDGLVLAEVAEVASIFQRMVRRLCTVSLGAPFDCLNRWANSSCTKNTQLGTIP